MRIHILVMFFLLVSFDNVVFAQSDAPSELFRNSLEAKFALESIKQTLSLLTGVAAAAATIIAGCAAYLFITMTKASNDIARLQGAFEEFKVSTSQSLERLTKEVSAGREEIATLAGRFGGAKTKRARSPNAAPAPARAIE